MIKHNVSLRSYNTFSIDVSAAEFARAMSISDLKQIIDNANYPPFILGGGSNMLLTKNLDALVIKNDIPGIVVIDQTNRDAVIKVGGGVVWHDLVLWSVDQGLGGIENLALIPGSVGAAPIQNIGAYGTELEKCFLRLDAVNLNTGESEEFNYSACQFGYRDSIFKHQLKGVYCISHVYLKLHKAPHAINDGYGAIRSTLDARGIDNPTIRNVCDAVIEIRSSKLPDPVEFGNSGSFFKNPVVSAAKWDALLKAFPDLVYYPSGERYKIPAGWLIEHCGWKGKRIGNVGCYEKQALVIVNYGGASGQEVLDHAMRVRSSVQEKFGIDLIPEVNIL